MPLPFYGTFLNLHMKLITNMIVLGLISSLIIQCSDDQESTSDVLGCTDPQATNFQPDATEDDGSCIYDSSEVYGCMDQNANNYSPDATVDDGSCTYDNNFPDWTINASQFQYNGSITASVEINGIIVGSDSDMLAGFSNDEIRGVVNGLYFAPADEYRFYLTLFSNDLSGDIISFKFYDESEDQIIALSEEIEFQSNTYLGSPLDPVILTGYTSVETYFSFNQSSLQGFYMFQHAEISGVSLSSNDWIGVLYQSICIGSGQWTGEYTTIPAMGNDGTEFTSGYIVDGEIPSFIIYDASENKYFNAIPGGLIDPGLSWSNLSIINVEMLSAQSE